MHIDIDAAEISKNRFADIPIVGNLADALPMLVDEIVAMKKKDQGEDISGWWRYLNRLKDRYPMGWTKTEDGMMAPQEVLSRLSKIAGPTLST